MNQLQQLIKESFKTSLKRYDTWTDPDGIVHDEYMVTLEPYCEDMEELSAKCGLSKSQLYRKLANPSVKFKLSELEELHKQIHWKEHQHPFEDEVTISIEETKKIITEVRRNDALEKQNVKHSLSQGFAKLENPFESGEMKTFLETIRKRSEEFEQISSRIKMQDDMIKRLLTLVEKQQTVIDKLSDDRDEEAA